MLERASPGDSTKSPDALVEGYVVEHEVRWHSMPECLNFGYDGENFTDDPAALRDDAAHGQQSRATHRPRVSVTLSDYLAADLSQSSDDLSCDFGWFTPTASRGSIDDLLPSADSRDSYADIRDSYPSLSPSYPLPSLLFTKFGSTTKTLSLSPDSMVDRAFKEPSSGEGLSSPNHYFNSGCGVNGHQQLDQQQLEQQQQQQQQEQQQRQHSSSQNPSTGIGGGIAAGCSGGRNARSGVPVTRRRNRMPEINQWHTLHSHVSRTGSLADAITQDSGICTMHLRRATFPISTRHFPEKPPTPSAPWHVTGRGGGHAWPGHTSLKANGRYPGGASEWKSADVTLGEEGRSCAMQADADSGHGWLSGRGGGGGYALREEVQDQPQMRKIKPKSYAWALTEIRVVKPRGFGSTPHAEYLVVACLGRERLVAGWRRASDFKMLAQVARRAWMSKACLAWETLERARQMSGGGPCNLPLILRPRRLDPGYLQNKARFLEEFLKQFIFEANSKDALLAFLDVNRHSTMEV